MKSFLPQCLVTLTFSFIALLPFPAKSFYNNFYVKSTATGTGDGSSWTNAYTDLQTAIDATQSGDVICIAAGTYFPTHKHRGDDLRNSTFYIDKDITLLGGFTGEPGTEGSLEGRNPTLHETILSGDLGLPADTTDNSLHVVFIDHVSDTMHLDGFIISGGNNFGGSGYETYGAGLYIDGQTGRCNPVIENCIIRDNQSDQGGGGITIIAESGGHANPAFINCQVLRNVSGGGGGLQGIVDGDGTLHPTMTNCAFKGNKARTAQGSAMSLIVHSSTCVLQMVNCVVTGNHAPFSSAVEVFLTGTGVIAPTIINSVFAGNNNGSFRVSSIGTVMSTIVVRNSIFWNNGFGHGLTVNNATADVTNSVMQNGFDGNNNLFLDPLFVELPSATNTPHTNGDVHLQPGSPAIEAGDNGAVPGNITHDAAGLPRIVNSNTGLPGGMVDMGAFEYQQAITGTTPVFKTMDWDVYPNPAIESVNVTLPQSDTESLLTLWTMNGLNVFSEIINAGQTGVAIDLNSMTEGMYVVSITSNGYTDVRKVFVSK